MEYGIFHSTCMGMPSNQWENLNATHPQSHTLLSPFPFSLSLFFHTYSNSSKSLLSITVAGGKSYSAIKQCSETLDQILCFDWLWQVM